MRTSSGFTLIELLIVVAIIGIVTAVAIPNLMNAIDRSRQSATMADMKAIGGALERYSIDHNQYPNVSDVSDLREHLEPEYIKRVPLEDGWNRQFVLELRGDGRAYTLRSKGRDGQAQSEPPAGRTKSTNADIIYAEGVFLQRPEGKQE